ncbi:T9SS type A sorting domain-containing protein [Flavobacterium sp.]|uniref:T9SS type A sorting domain-containing protein n=1 Tax=Flavobacterium sp. TaxID=239 RepID=UPI0026027ED1|nr:T9SS type A sorting domain-containing protein [Flavobacterium sp.]
MKKMIFFLLFSCNYLIGQQSINSSGGNGIGIGGSFSCSLGQTDYVAVTGTNGKVSQGVQQPFEFFVLDVNQLPEISLEWRIYPNPTTDIVFIKNDNDDVIINYQLIDVTGKLIATSTNKKQSNEINLTSLEKGNYILVIQTKSNLTKTFKIIKK